MGRSSPPPAFSFKVGKKRKYLEALDHRVLGFEEISKTRARSKISA